MTDSSQNYQKEAQNLTNFLKEFDEESDRAAAILGAAKLDTLLYQIIQSVLRPNVSKNDELLDGDSPLGTFSSRIMFCYRIGVINDLTAWSLNMIRRIRNQFAHEVSGSIIDSGSHRDRIVELIKPLRNNYYYNFFLQNAILHSEGHAAQFRVAVTLIALRLTSTLNEQSPIYKSSPPPLLIHKSIED